MAHVPGTSLKRLVKRGPLASDCWEWLAYKNEAGYGMKTWNGTRMSARRWLWEILEGRIAKGKVLKDTCTNPGCVNPAHLRAVTPLVANRERSDLTPGDRIEILSVKDVYRTGTEARRHQARDLAERFGVAESTITYVWRNHRLRTTKPMTYAGKRPVVIPEHANELSEGCS